MASIQGALRTRLTGDATVSQLVSTRVFPVGQIPQKAVLPWVTHQRISGGNILSLDGPNDTKNIRMQVNCVAETYAEAVVLADAVKSSLNGWERAYSDPNVSSCMMDSENDDFDTPVVDNEQAVNRIMQDYSLWYSGG